MCAFTQSKITKLTAISSHCFAPFSAKDVWMFVFNTVTRGKTPILP